VFRLEGCKFLDVMFIEYEHIHIEAHDTATSREVLDYVQNRSEPPTVAIIDV
jgi:hypothetical protein